jgi:hypothetical protein
VLKISTLFLATLIRGILYLLFKFVDLKNIEKEKQISQSASHSPISGSEKIAFIKKFAVEKIRVITISAKILKKSLYDYSRLY